MKRVFPGIIDKKAFTMKTMPRTLGLVMILGVGTGLFPPQAWTQEIISDQVMITSGQGRLFGITSGEGVSREFLTAGEEILAIETKGKTGFVHTTKRLLGFSARLQRWVSVNLSSAERILKWTVTPRMVVVQGRERVYGFQSNLARWKKEAWRSGEMYLEDFVEDFVGVLVTDRRALGFSAFTGGFFSQDLPLGNPIQEVQSSDNVVVIHLLTRMLVFRSGLAVWAELPK